MLINQSNGSMDEQELAMEPPAYSSLVNNDKHETNRMVNSELTYLEADTAKNNPKESLIIDSNIKNKTNTKVAFTKKSLERMDTKISWVVLCIALIGQAMSVGFYYCYGSIYVEILRQYPGSETKAAWIGSLGYSFCFLLGIATATFCQKIGCGYVMSLGGGFVGLGMITSSFATSPFTLYITYGAINSIGTSCLFFSSILALPLYFKKHLSIANGIVSAGSGIGGMALSPIFDYFINGYGLRTTFQLYAIIALIPLLGGFLIKRKEEVSKEVEASSKFIDRFIDRELLRNKAFVLFTLAMSLILFAYYIPYVHLINFSLLSGISSNNASLLPSMICASSVVGKIVFGYIGQLRRVNRLYMFQIFLLIISISLTLLPMAAQYYQLCIFSILFGLCEGGFCSYIFIITSMCIRVDQLSVGFGMMYTVTSFFSLVGPPFAGFLYETSGSYETAFISGGAFLITGVISLFFIPYLVPRDIYKARKLDKHAFMKEFKSKKSTSRKSVKEKDLSPQNDLKMIKSSDSLILSMDNESGVYSIGTNQSLYSNADFLLGNEDTLYSHSFTSNCKDNSLVGKTDSLYSNNDSLLEKEDTIYDLETSCYSTILIDNSHSKDNNNEEKLEKNFPRHKMLSGYLSVPNLANHINFYTMPPYHSQYYLDRYLEDNTPVML